MQPLLEGSHPLYIAALTAVSVGQVKSKDAPCSDD